MKKVQGKVGSLVLERVRKLAASFDDPTEAEGFKTHHPAIRLLSLHGVLQEEALASASS